MCVHLELITGLLITIYAVLLVKRGINGVTILTMTVIKFLHVYLKDSGKYLLSHTVNKGF